MITIKGKAIQYMTLLKKVARSTGAKAINTVVKYSQLKMNKGTLLKTQRETLFVYTLGETMATI